MRQKRISTTDNRLIRRMVRDYRYRGYSAEETLMRWPSVRRGEKRNIFPYQDMADAAFNSALDYELGVLKLQAESLLRQIKPASSHYGEARRLLQVLQAFLPISREFVPDNSILREFVGGSAYKY
jgi:uridine kinase